MSDANRKHLLEQVGILWFLVLAGLIFGIQYQGPAFIIVLIFSLGIVTGMGILVATIPTTRQPAEAETEDGTSTEAT